MHYILLIILLLFTLNSNANNNNFIFNGSLTQNYISTTDNYFYNDFDLHEIILSMWYDNDFLRSNNIHISTQAILRKSELTLDYAFISKSFTLSDSDIIRFRIGKVKTPFGLFNEIRDVASARPLMILPQTIYNDKMRSGLIGFYGGIVEYQKITDFGIVTASLGVGNPNLDSDIESTFLLLDCGGKTSPNDISTIFNISTTTPDNSLKFNLTYVNTGFTYDGHSKCDRYLKPGGTTTIDPILLSLQYSPSKKITLTGEVMINKIKREGYGRMFNDFEQTAVSYYLMGEWFLSSNFSLVGVYERAQADIDDKNGIDQQRRTFGIIPNDIGYSRIRSIGINYKYNNVLLQGIYQKHDGTLILDSRFNEFGSKRVQDWELFGVAISYQF